MKKIFIISQVKNEADIIESFCRYNLTYSDGMLIRDNGSIDNTKKIIQNLINEGLPIYWIDDVKGKNKYAKKAIDEYGADLIIPLDADEFLYHIDGINPRETLEALREDVEYQVIWRTYIYEKEPDIKLGFMPNNFTQYRNPEMENPDKYNRHKKVIANKYLIQKKQAVFIMGCHFLLYPEEHRESVSSEIIKKLVFAHFPIRSKKQVIKKIVPGWIYKRRTLIFMSRDTLDAYQIGVLFNEIKDEGDITSDRLKKHSIEYAMMMDSDKNDVVKLVTRDELDKIEEELGDNLTLHDPMDVSFCADKLNLCYTSYSEDHKVFMRATLTEIDNTVTFLASESDRKSKLLGKYLPSPMSCIYLDTGNGFNQEEVLAVPMFRHESYFEAAVNIPLNVRSIRFDPVEGFACILDNVQIVTNTGKIEYMAMNGFAVDDIYIFDNWDPQVFIDFNGRSISYLKITGYIRYFNFDDISFLSNAKHIFERYSEVKSEVKVLTLKHDELLAERNNLINKYPELTVQNCTLFIDTGKGYSADEIITHSFTGNEIKIFCQIPENTKKLRLDPVEGYGCIISNLKILSYNGIVDYEPVNGYKDNHGDLVFVNSDPQIELYGTVYWIRLEYRINLLSDFSYLKVFKNFIAINQERNILASERDGLVVERDGLVAELNRLTAERNALTAERDGLLNSRSWRFTKIMRDLAAFIRRHKTLRFLAKGLLSIKRNVIGKTVKKTSVLSEINSLFYESEYQENIDFSKHEPKVKAIAFYLPQFHSIPENDEWWGKDFTEWTNTRKAKPRFMGHYQPREPHNDFGYYNLTDVGTIKKQVKLAKQHGIFGFCFYFYWFSGKRLLYKPLDLFLSHPEIDINFCLCWANENWTKRWDGFDDDVLMSQDYSDVDPYRFIDDIKKYILDKRYIRLEGKAIILVYRPESIPNIADVFSKWRTHAVEIGIGEIQILACKTWFSAEYYLHIENIIDGAVEFPPHHIPRYVLEDISYNENTGVVYNYEGVVAQVKYELTTKSVNNYLFTLYRGCMLGWDNAARKKTAWFSFYKFSLRSFFEWASMLTEDAVQTKKPFIFINAWNEWGEGTYLEPDKKYGYASINTLSKAIYGLQFNYTDSIISRIKKKIIRLVRKLLFLNAFF